MPHLTEPLPHKQGDVVSGVVTDIYDDGELELDVGGVIGWVPPEELILADSESAQDRYAVGDAIHDLFVLYVFDRWREMGIGLSVRRGSPGYVEALNAHHVGEVVPAATVSAIYDGHWLGLDVDGVAGWVDPTELALADDESAQNDYAIGDTIHDLFVYDINLHDRHLYLSGRRDAPGYVEALDSYTVGDVVSATVTDFRSDGGLCLDIGGVVGAVPRSELTLTDGEATRDHYAVGDTIHDLFVGQVNRDARDLVLSVRRNAPGYVEALDSYMVGDVVSATVTDSRSDGGLRLDVGGVVGAVPRWELTLADGEAARDHYAVGEAVHDLFIWQVRGDTRDLALSPRRNTPSYAKAFTQVSSGDPLESIVIEVNEGGIEANEGGIWLDVAGVVGWLPVWELQLDDGESPGDRYSPGDSVATRVWLVDQQSRTVILSMRRHAPDPPKEQVAADLPIEGTVWNSSFGGIEIFIPGQKILVPHCELSLDIGERPNFEIGQRIRVVALAVDGDGNPTALSHRRTLAGWQAAVDRLTPGTIVENAIVLPLRAVLAGEKRAAVDVGPLTGYVPADEMDAETARDLMTGEANTPYPVVVQSIDLDRVEAVVSHEKFAARWRELAEDISEGAQVEAEFRRVSSDQRWAILDLRSGLLAEMPLYQLPMITDGGKQRLAREGEKFAVRITHKHEEEYFIMAENKSLWLEELIGEPESQTLEFKEVLKGVKDTDDEKEMTRRAIRTINAFLNTDGGQLIIGVRDRTREIVGLEGDPGLDEPTIEKKIDQATQILETNLENLEPRDLLNDDLGGLVVWDTPLVSNRTLLVITCKRGPDAGVSLKIKGKAEFWVRDGSRKKQLRTTSEIRDHLRTRAQRTVASDEAASDA